MSIATDVSPGKPAVVFTAMVGTEAPIRAAFPFYVGSTAVALVLLLMGGSPSSALHSGHSGRLVGKGNGWLLFLCLRFAILG
jgi:hypothetical protein